MLKRLCYSHPTITPTPLVIRLTRSHFRGGNPPPPPRTTP